MSQIKMRCSVPSSILLSVMNIPHAADLTETELIFHWQEVAAADRVYVAWGNNLNRIKLSLMGVQLNLASHLLRQTKSSNKADNPAV